MNARADEATHFASRAARRRREDDVAGGAGTYGGPHLSVTLQALHKLASGAPSPMKPTLRIAIAVISLVVGPHAVQAQNAPNAMPASATASSVTTPLDAKDTAYLHDAASGSAYELQLSELGAEKGSNANVLGYATALVLAHASYTTSLMSLAHAKHVVLPTGAEAGDQARLPALAKQSGPAFDRAFLEEEIRVNSEDISKTASELAATSDSQVTMFLQEFQTGDSFHLASAKQLLQSISAAAIVPTR